MDLRQYFRKIREIESSIEDRDALVSSLETPEGGKAGIVSEVSRPIAAKMIAEGRAVLATAEEREKYLRDLAERVAESERVELAKKVHVTLLREPELREHTPENKAGKK